MKLIPGITLLLISLSMFSNAQVKFQTGKPVYIVSVPNSTLENRITNQLSEYVSRVVGQPSKIVEGISLVPAKSPVILLAPSNSKSFMGLSSPEKSRESFAIETRIIGKHPAVVLIGNTELGLKRAIQKLIIKSEQAAQGLLIPELHLSESPWIPKREFTLANWTPQFPRGVFYNPNADNRGNIWLYNDAQILNYVTMCDWFGFSGGQFATSTHGYAITGSPEAFRERQLKVAKALRVNGQNVTYRIWASQFTGFGWADPDVTYTPSPGNTAFNDPKVRATFEKQYDSFATMAPYVDMIIAQYFDPGQLKDHEDVYNYMHLLIDKFRTKKPEVQLGIMFWSAGAWKEGTEAAFMQELLNHNFNYALLLENTMPHTYKPGVREALHEEAKRHNLKMGVWGWHTIEMETDQNPKMHVNAKLLSKFYRQMRDGVDKIHPISYWSEMEAYHLNNIFTMYAAGQLLWNPDRDPDEILAEISFGIWGPKNGPKVLDAVKLIEDTRTGPTWETYWWSLSTRRLGTEDPNIDLERSNKVIADLRIMKTDLQYVPKFPLPFPPATFIELMLPHIMQIKAFAEFRIEEKKIRKAAKNGASKEELTRLSMEAWKPVPEYNTWIGTFGQAEFREQETMMDKLAKDLDIKITPPLWTLYRDADRYLQKIQNLQKASSKPVKFKPGDAIGRSEFYWPAEKVQKYLTLLVNMGSMKKNEDDFYQLTNWEDYRLQ